MIIRHLKALTTLSCLSVGLLFGSCDDDLTEVGTSIQPPGDIITVYTDTFQIQASTMRLDSIFAKSTDCLLGEMYDPLYGYIKADFLCQFYCEEGYQFSQTPYEGKIDSVVLVMYYADSSWYGDPLSPMEVSVYPIDRPLKKNFYTNDDARNYCDMSTPLGVKSYTPYDTNVPDSIRDYVDNTYGKTYMPWIRVRLPHELGQRFYDETLDNPASFATQEAFNAFFPGIYVTNTYGSGNLISTNSAYIEMYIYYNYAAKDTLGQDSLANHGEIFATSKEVIQINRFEHSQIDHLLKETDLSRTYITSPGGVCTKLVVPTTQIAQRMDVTDRLINDFSLNLKYLPEDTWEYAYSPPNHLLLVPEDSVTTFFEKGYVDDNANFFISYMRDSGSGYISSTSTNYGYNPSTRTYSFGNISTLIKSHIKASPDKDLSLLVIPVTREYSMYSYYYYYSTKISHTFNLSGVKIRTDEEHMKVVLLSSKFEDDE